MGQKSQHGNMLSAARGQSIPFWTFATIGVLAMMLFVLNYALNVSWTIRALNQAILNTINHNCGCSATIGGTCEQNYNQLVQAYTQVEKNYADLVHLLGQANQLTQAGQNTAAQKIFSL